MDEIRIAERITRDSRVLEREGLNLYTPESIAEVTDLMAQTGRTQQSAMLSLANNDFTSANSKFLFLMHDGSAIAGCRTKCVDLQDETFESHQRRTIQQWYGLDEDPIESLARPLNKLITGKHIYAGELEFREGFRGSIATTTAFSRVMVASSFLRWPDISCIYCILPEHHRRLAVDYGFCTTVRNAFNWKDHPPGGRLHDWLVALSSRDQLLHDLTDGYWGQIPREQE